MRLHRLEIEGFGPFLKRQAIDFDAFADDGVFLIGGRTGAGKSSILDAVCFGLYGNVPRYEGGEKRLRSDHCEPADATEVVVEFSTVSGRYRVTRSPEYQRPAKRGGGLTKQASSVALEESVGGHWIGRAAREVDVAHALDEILQLNLQQFLQVILLAQGRFARFLLADSRERQSLLRRLFGTGRFEDYQARFDERRRTSEQALGAGRATVIARVEQAEKLVAENALHSADPSRTDAESPASDEPAPSLDGRLDALRRAKARADYRHEQRGQERDQAESAHRTASVALAVAREERQAQAERDRARSALTALDAAAGRIAADRRTLDDARAAEVLRHVLSTAERAADAATAAALEVAAAEKGWRGRTADEDDLPEGSSAEALREWASALTRSSGAWQQAATAEAQLAAYETAVTTAQSEAEAAAVERAAREHERAALPAAIDALTAERDDLRRRADRAADLEATVAQAASRLAGARDVVARTEERGAAERTVADREQEAAAAFAHAADLRRRREAGMAGELAEALIPGEACSVCGATEHPAPAAHADPVSAEDVAEATEARERSAEQVRLATSALAAVDAALSAATAHADGRTVEAAEAELSAAGAERDAAVAATTAAADAEHRLTERRAAAEGLESEIANLSVRHAEASERLALARQTLASAQESVAQARGAFATVAARVADASARIGAAQGLATALEERHARAEAASAALAEQQEALAASPFEDAAAAGAALRSPADQAALDERIAAHAAERTKERAILFDLELRTLPDELIDLAPHEAAESDARTAWTTAVDEASRAGVTSAQLGSLLESAAAEHARGAAAAEEHETLQRLADTVAGRGANTYRMNLETFVLAAELEEIVAAANLRLSDMSSGRYQLQHSDARAARGAASGLGIVVFDAFTGQTRPAQSLSGGETFLGSLALALGLAEVVTARAGGIQLDTLFIDEGFGSLDGETLDVAMRTLDELRAGGRTVGVISHVEAMQEQIPAQITVRATPEGPSVIDA
ncbi:AAA family ATPase [Microbacterium azadirachtae]|uniref:Nuclease SbcCD subunit C n=1 Tax=Microbacterium azadirachtae TaxID=582680 RepID=A0A0F0LLE1_9MICO|nr:SMC family ATPase [Microbacterium azadirachtae]KJL32336.1 Nuclease SbcCD subunit C [Microbacterium azadirachtae]